MNPNNDYDFCRVYYFICNKSRNFILEEDHQAL
jgi:hypothetical protein